MGWVPLPARRRASKIGRLPSPRYRAGAARYRQRHRQGLRPRKAARRACTACYFGESTARSPQFHGVALSEAAASDREQSVLGTLLPTNNDKRCRNGVAGSRRQIEVDSRTPRTVGRVPSHARRRPSKIGRLPSPHSLTQGYVVRSSAAKDRFRNRQR